jgi:hypothetical protein
MTSAVIDSSPDLRLVPPTAPATGPRSLRDAIEAVHDHCRQTEMRRMVRAREIAIERSKQSVTVSRSTFDSMQQRLRETAALRRLTEGGPMWMVAFDSMAPFALREVPPALARHLGNAPEAGRTLSQLFVSADAARLQRALFDRDTDIAMTLQLRRADGHGPRVMVHLLPADDAEPDLRWACLVRLPQDDETVVERTPARRPLVKPTQRPRTEAWPLQSR